MAKVLVVALGEGERAAPLLVSEGFVVVTATGTDAIRALEVATPDLALIEAETLRNGVARLCAAMRAATSAPIVALSANASEREIIDLYSAGVDGYIPSSVGQYELVARVRAMLRRAPQQQAAETDIVRVGSVVLDCASRELRVNGELVVTPRREFDIAALLMRKVGVVVTRSELLRELWGAHRDTKSLDVQVGRLRGRLAKAEGVRRIVTVRGVGYRFLTDAEIAQAQLRDLGKVIDLRPAPMDLVGAEATSRDECSALGLGGSQLR